MLEPALEGTEGGFCAWCGLAADRCDGACREPGQDPRFCRMCGRRLTVFVSPGLFVARCRDHPRESA